MNNNLFVFCVFLHSSKIIGIVPTDNDDNNKIAQNERNDNYSSQNTYNNERTISSLKSSTARSLVLIFMLSY